MTQSNLEATMAFQIRAAGLPQPEREFKAIPGREFRFDFAWPDPKHNLLLEVQGGIYGTSKSRADGKQLGHSSISGIIRDCTKHNLAVLDGWRVLLVTEKNIQRGEALKWIQQLLQNENQRPGRGATL